MRGVIVKFRVNPLELQTLNDAAARSNITMSEWLRNLALREADRIRKVPAAPKRR